MRWPGSFPRPAIVVAESLRPLATLPCPRGVTPIPANLVARAIAAHLTPPRADGTPPRWLRPEQAESYQRALASLRHHGGALLADPVGSGKSWVALAIVRALAVPVTCIVPAAIAPQWRRVAREAGVEIVVQSHESWSRAARPLATGLVVVDESHRFRRPGIRRYRFLASALLGQRVLLLSATPVVNRMEDLLHQLLLCCRDDALVASGTPSLAIAIREGSLPSAMADLVIRAQHAAAGPPRRVRQLGAMPPEEQVAREAWQALAGLRLSPSPSVERLMRGCLAYSLSSSMAAALEALQRYRQLLRQAEDGLRAGVRLDRRTIQRALLGDAAQTVLWSLFQEGASPADLCFDDLGRLDAAHAQLAALELQGDHKADRLRALVADGVASIVFCAFRATVHALRRRITPGSRVAWCTGEAAGIGTTRMARDMVLGWFRPGARDPTGLGPWLLVTTDVAAEGLDLQRAARVIHYDLPWTSVRLEQRAGRVARVGSLHAAVDLVELKAPAVLEGQLGLRATLARKRHLARWGDSEPPRMAWEARPALSREADGKPQCRGLAVGLSARVRALAAFETVQGSAVLGRMALVFAGGRWQDDADLLAQALEDAEATPMTPVGMTRGARASLQSALRCAARALRPDARHGPEPLEQAQARRVLRRWARQLSRLRDQEALGVAGRAHSTLARGLSAAERAWAAELAQTGDEQLGPVAARVPGSPAGEPLRLRLVGCIHFEPPCR